MDPRAQRDPNQNGDQDIHKGAIESPESPGNPNAPALDENGLPNDPVAIAQDVIGANEDETQG
jgi:hypothetical protein